MPSSRPDPIPVVVHLVQQLRPRSILDVGVGFGKWGHLFREYTDINEAERDPRRYERAHWQIRIDGIEGHAAYLTDMHRFLYTEIHLGDAAELLPRLPEYDLIFFGDIIEHFEKQRGRQLLQDAHAKARKAVVLTTPKHETAQDDLCHNELERHRSLWSAGDFRAWPGAQVRTLGGDTLLAVLPKGDVPRLLLTPPRRPPANVQHEWQTARAALLRLLPTDEPFILVDEEQLRALLPHRQVRSFLERHGAYWGPPRDAEEAIRELERMAGEGAQRIVFIPATVWWLDHYPAFHDYLRARWPRQAGSTPLVIFQRPG